MVNQPSCSIENHDKNYPFQKRPAPSNANRQSSQLSSPTRAVSSPGAFFQTTSQLEATGSDVLQKNSFLPNQLEKPRVVSFPDNIYPSRLSTSRFSGTRLEIINGVSFGEHSFSSDSSDSIEFILTPDAHLSTTFPNVTTNDGTQNNTKDKHKRSGDEDWLTWTTAPPRPIPALHGPASLPYARCPSGAEGTVIEEPSLLPHVIWGLEPNDTFGFQYSQNVRKKYHNRFSNQKNRIYATSVQPTMPNIQENKEGIMRDNFISLTPSLSETSIINDGYYFERSFDGSERDTGLLGNPFLRAEPTTVTSAVSSLGSYPLGLGFGFHPQLVEPSFSYKEPVSRNPNYLPTPPNSSSPHWNATFSPPNNSFLVPLPMYDADSSELRADLGNSISNDTFHYSSRTQILNASQSPRTYISSKAQDTQKRGKVSLRRQRLSMETVLEEPLLSPLIDLYPSTADTIELQPQTAKEYTLSEIDEGNPLAKIAVKLPGHPAFRNRRANLDVISNVKPGLLVVN